MAQTIDTQLMSMKVQKYLNTSQEKMAESAQKMSSGLRVNSATDDAAGLAIAERMNSQVRGMNIGIRNANDGISTSQIAEGGLRQVNNLLQRMRDLALQSANNTNSSTDRKSLNAEFTALNNEIAQVVTTTKINGEAVLANDNSSLNYQTGPGTGDEHELPVDLVEIVPLKGNITTYEASLATIGEIDARIAEVASARANFGAMQSRFESTIANLQVGIENQSAARGRIMDAELAVEAAMLTRSKIAQQAGTAITSQANVSAESVAQLLR